MVREARIAQSLDAAQTVANEAVRCFVGAVRVLGRRPGRPLDRRVPVEDEDAALRRQQRREAPQRIVIDLVEHVEREDAIVRRSLLRGCPVGNLKILDPRARDAAADDREHFGLHVIGYDVHVGPSLGERQRVAPGAGAEIEDARTRRGVEQFDDCRGGKPAFAFRFVEPSGSLVRKYVRLLSSVSRLMFHAYFGSASAGATAMPRASPRYCGRFGNQGETVLMRLTENVLGSYE